MSSPFSSARRVLGDLLNLGAAPAGTQSEARKNHSSKAKPRAKQSGPVLREEQLLANERNKASALELRVAELERQLTETSELVPVPTRHPVFGTLLADMGQKQLWLAEALALSEGVPVWAEQRPCDPDRVDEIVKLKQRQLRQHQKQLPDAACGFMGGISLFQYVDSDGVFVEHATARVMQPCGVFDGQHRVAAIQRLVQRGEAFRVLLEVYPVVARSDVRDLFLEVPDILLPQFLHRLRLRNTRRCHSTIPLTVARGGEASASIS